MLLCKICGWEVVKDKTTGRMLAIERASSAAGPVPCGNCDPIEVRVKAPAPVEDDAKPTRREK